MPTQGGGAFSLWGLGGNSSVDILISDQVRPERNIYGDNDRDQYFRTGMGIVGATYTKPVNERTYVKTTLAFSGDWQDSRHEYVTRDLAVQGGDTVFTNVATQPFMAYLFDKRRVSLAAHANRKLEPSKGTAIDAGSVWAALGRRDVVALAATVRASEVASVGSLDLDCGPARHGRHAKRRDVPA